MDQETRKKIIDSITSLFPIDSQYAETNKIGMKLLLIAILKHDWRDLPDDILITYNSLCWDLENGSGVVKHMVKNFNL